MNISQYLKESNQTQMEFARLLGVSQGMVAFWLHNKPPTIERAIEIEKLTKGAVRCEDLRPDVDWAYLRNSAPEPAQPAEPSPPLTTPTPEPIHECASGDPRYHPDRRHPDKRQTERRYPDKRQAPRRKEGV